MAKLFGRELNRNPWHRAADVVADFLDLVRSYPVPPAKGENEDG
jgi:hypothetical protein